MSLYQFDGVDTWSLDQTLTSPEPSPGSDFGGGSSQRYGMDLECTHLAAAQIGTQEVWVYERDASNAYVSPTKFTEPGSVRYGHALDLEGDRLVISDPRFDSDRGAVHYYRRLPGTNDWEKIDTFLPPVGAPLRFGDSVQIAGDMLLIGATDDSAVPQQNGKIYSVNLANGPPQPVPTLQPIALWLGFALCVWVGSKTLEAIRTS